MTELQKEQLRFYYHFMICDGKLTKEEQIRLSEICKQMDITEEEKNELIKNVEQKKHYTDFDGASDGKRVSETLKSLLTNADWEINNLYNRKTRLETAWNLINLAYADDEYSQPENDFILTLCEKWEIDGSIIAEFKDTAETISMLYKNRHWINKAETIERLMSYLRITIKNA